MIENNHINASIPDTESPEYTVVILLGKIPYGDFLSPSTWTQFSSIIKPLVDKSSFQGILSSNQLFHPDFKWVKLPKSIKWGAKNASLIFEQYSKELRKPEDLYSFKLHGVFPDFKICNKEGIFPDLYFRIDTSILGEKETRFTVACLVAVKNELIKDDLLMMDKIINDLRDLLKGVYVIKKSRRFQRKMISGGYTDTIPFIMPTTVLENSDKYILRNEEKDWEIVLKP